MRDSPVDDTHVQQEILRALKSINDRQTIILVLLGAIAVATGAKII